MPLDAFAAAIQPEPFELWCAYPDDLLSQPIAAACAALLSPDEQARCGSLRFDPLRREFLATRALLRTVLSRHHSLPPQAWRFRVNSHGKPETDPPCGLRFNLSNAPGLVVCLIARNTDVGVDTEPASRAGEILALAPDVFSLQEQAQLQSLPAAARRDRALSLWTLKEAYIKARGLGLSLPLAGFSFLFGGEPGIRLEIDPALNDDPSRWRFHLLDHAGHRIALMAALPVAPALHLWESRLSSAPPRQIPLSPESWFPR